MAQEPLTYPRLIVCEGPSDVGFFRAFLKSRKLPDFCVRHTKEGSPTKAGGRDQFGSYLFGLPSVIGFYDLTDIVLVSDCDNDPKASFKYICDQISSAKPVALPLVNFNTPTKPNEPKAKAAQSQPGAPNLAVLMLPWADEVGCLETLCLSSAATAAPAVAPCVDAYAKCAGADKWNSASKQAKMKLQTLMAGVFKKHPSVALGRVWTEDPKEKLIPLNHSCFARLEDFLKSFA